MKRNPFRLSMLAVSVLAGGGAWADNAAAETVSVGLETVQVQSAGRSTRTEHLDLFTTSAMRTTTGLALTPRETPQSVSVLTRSYLDERGIGDLEEAMRNTTGVNVVRDSDRFRFLSRGFYIDQIEEDGISSSIAGRRSDNTIQNAESLTDLAVYDHVEVVRGATGLTQANGEPGGTVNAVRKRPTAARQGQAGLGAGSFDTYRLDLDVSGSLNRSRTIRGRAVGAVRRAGSFLDGVTSRRHTLYGVLEADVGENGLWTAGAMYQNGHSVPDVFGQPVGSADEPLALDRHVYSGAPWNRAESGKFNLFTEFRRYFGDNWRWNTLLDYRRDRAFREYAALSSGPTWRNTGQIFGSASHRSDSQARQWALQSNLSGKFQAFGRTHDVFAAYSHQHRRTDTETMQHWSLWADPNHPGNQFCASMGYPHWCSPTLSYDYPTDPFDPSLLPPPRWDNLANLGDIDFKYNPIRRRTVSQARSHALAGGVRIGLADTLHILAGGRYTRWQYREHTDDILNPSNPVPLETLGVGHRGSRFVPYFGMVWDVRPRHSLYASYTSIFKPQPEFRGESGSNLPPVNGTNYELGWKSSWYHNRLNSALALFFIDQKNRGVYSHADSSGRAVYANTGRVSSKGMDAEISGHLTGNWKLFAGYTYNNSRYRNAENGHSEAGNKFSQHTPRHIFRLHTDYRLPGRANRWHIGGGLSAQSGTADMYGRLPQGGYTLWHANIRYLPAKNLSFSLNANNLSNKFYWENNANRGNGGYNFPGAPRSFSFSVNWKM